MVKIEDGRLVSEYYCKDKMTKNTICISKNYIHIVYIKDVENGQH